MVTAEIGIRIWDRSIGTHTHSNGFDSTGVGSVPLRFGLRPRLSAVLSPPWDGVGYAQGSSTVERGRLEVAGRQCVFRCA